MSRATWGLKQTKATKRDIDKSTTSKATGSVEQNKARFTVGSKSNAWALWGRLLQYLTDNTAIVHPNTFIIIIIIILHYSSSLVVSHSYL